ncbi:efflux RND transporter periplasmic adaptor subunit [Methylobacterium sp. ID0610]|uniref:efflux RND transporter periplasmic adaptor subunit n=1 Tax=Methylobacterium carpenticola TaxID=3344827 RepID=UPI0036838B56
MSNGVAADKGGDAAATDERPLVLEPALWQRLQAAATFEAAAAAWLPLQAQLLRGAQAGTVLAGDAPAALAPLAVWPAGSREDLAEAARVAAAEKRPIVQEPASGDGAALVAVPLVEAEGGDLFGCAAFRLVARDRDVLRAAIRQVQWGAAWLAAKRGLACGRDERRQLARARAALDLLAGVLEQERFKAACMAAATDLAITFDCMRAAVGFSRKGTARVAAISHTAQFERSMNLVRKLGACMDEALDQRSLVLFPAPEGDTAVTRAHADLARLRHDGRVLTVPFLANDHFAGAFTLERAGDTPFDAETIAIIAAACAAIGPVLDEKRQNDRWLAVKAGEAAGALARRIVGPNHAGLKLTLGALGLAGLLLGTVTADYRVTADARVEGLVRRAVVAPYDGYLKLAEHRAGDMVHKGDLLAALEDRDLVLERLRWVTERQQRRFEYDKALATRQPATINVVRSQIDQAEAQINLVDEQLARLKFYAPFDGLIVSGDLSQSIGGAIGRGQVLFEVAPLDDYRVVINVDERFIADLREGQTGQMLAGALPDQPYPIVVQTITPVAEVRNGRNMFRVEGQVTAASTRLRPGMEGIAKIEVDRRLLAWTWARPILDWLRLAVWHWVP